MVNEKISIARKNYWNAMTVEERSNRMRDIAKKKNAKMTFKQRREHALMMVAARRKIIKKVV